MVAKNSVGIALAHHYILQQSPTLIIHLYFLQVVLSCSFGGQKNEKPRHTYSPVHLFFAQESLGDIPRSKRVLKHTPLGS